MINLILAIICSASIGLILKYSETNLKNRLAVTTSNYFVAFVVSFVIFYSKNSIYEINLVNSYSNFLSEFNIIFENSKFSFESSIIWAILIGVIGGFLYFYGFILIQKSINKNGVGVTGAFSKASILIPIVISIFFWNEIPSLFQYFGIFLTLFAIFKISNVKLSDKKLNINFVLINMFIFVGLAEFSNKLFQNYGDKSLNTLFLFFVFFTSFVISFISTLKSNKKIEISDIFTGFLVGIPNMLTSYFLIKSFETIKTSVVFPVYSSMAIVLMAVGGNVLFKEKLNRNEIYAILIIIVALVFLNI